MSFPIFFERATGYPPFHYQISLAEGTQFPSVLHVPTGSGKTAAVILAWLWRRRFHPDSEVRRRTPRRLVYCLPMRVLVEQTVNTAKDIFARVTNDDLDDAESVEVYTCMGGELEEDWLLEPGRDCVIVGTQDMLLSRALNRGYALSRFRWPMAFGALNSDVLWVFDEVQLMGAALPTSAQLTAFRKSLGAFENHHTLWLSATLSPDWLRTVDHPTPPDSTWLRLGDTDRSSPVLRKRLQAPKRLEPIRYKDQETKSKRIAESAQRVIESHEHGTLTLCIVNTVQRARELYDQIRRELRKGNTSSPETLLLHSRFRPADRAVAVEHLAKQIDPNGQGCIVVSTQVVEAGIDISARTLVTELAPWPSLVQRFGRCNRYGEYDDARIYWLDLQESDSPPYDPEDIQFARERLHSLEGASVAPDELPGIESGSRIDDVLRRKDLIDLFDTTPDLSGNDIDVSRFIRALETADVQFFWRTWEGSARGYRPSDDLDKAQRDELCPVPIKEAREFVQKSSHTAWSWNHLDRRWTPLRYVADIRPGFIVLLPGEAGGYGPEVGWSPTGHKDAVTPVKIISGSAEEAAGDDRASFGVKWQTLRAHTDAVRRELDSLTRSVDSADIAPWMEALAEAAAFHDWGKAHEVFQDTLRRSADASPDTDVLWAKAPAKRGRRPARHSRPHFRHEVASAIAYLIHTRAMTVPTPTELDKSAPNHRNLVAYLIAGHHGRARLALLSLPNETHPTRVNGHPRRYAMGIWDGDSLPPVQLTEQIETDPITLDLAIMELGFTEGEEPSWMECMLALRDHSELGPFRLAYLEWLLRAADARASRSPEEV